jgi:hypothetical protein
MKTTLVERLATLGAQIERLKQTERRLQSILETGGDDIHVDTTGITPSGFERLTIFIKNETHTLEIFWLCRERAILKKRQRPENER